MLPFTNLIHRVYRLRLRAQRSARFIKLRLQQKVYYQRRLPPKSNKKKNNSNMDFDFFRHRFILVTILHNFDNFCLISFDFA
jgi:hypothetical protein